jgi:hypothetical protein
MLVINRQETSRLGDLRLQPSLEIRDALGLDHQQLAIGVEHFLGESFARSSSVR